ncbi:unnamed protein product [Urochloa humidicola]
MKLLHADVDHMKFGGDTPYIIMFGSDICGYQGMPPRRLIYVLIFPC